MIRCIQKKWGKKLKPKSTDGLGQCILVLFVKFFSSSLIFKSNSTKSDIIFSQVIFSNDYHSFNKYLTIVYWKPDHTLDANDKL